ncbi:hypothetical protein BH09PSE4_BH09PSE4_14290 [soil metagenome]
MKMFKLAAAAGLVIASMGVATAADAQQYRGDRSSSYRHDDNRRDYRESRFDRGRHYGWRNNGHHRVRCWTEWRHHHRVRICR